MVNRFVWGFIIPCETRPHLSAHTSMGGRITSALRSATATFMPTTRPKSRNSGKDEKLMTATPLIAVAADTMKARPVLAAVEVEKRVAFAREAVVELHHGAPHLRVALFERGERAGEGSRQRCIDGTLLIHRPSFVPHAPKLPRTV